MCRGLICLAACVPALALIVIPTGAARAFDRGDPALVGYWSFNEGSGTVASDLSSNGYDGTLNGGVTWTDGIYGSGLHFDGSGANVGTGKSILNGVPGFTLAGWISASNVDVYSSLFGQNDLIEFGFIGGSEVGTWLLGNNWQLVSAAYPFEYPSWHHVALTGDVAGVVIYIDGQEAARDAGAVSSGSSGFTFKIGADVFNTTGDPFLGEIDDVWVFSRALTAEEIQILMQSSGGYPYALSPNPADGAIQKDTWVNLSWAAGDFAVSHDVYLGDNFGDVDAGTGDTFRGNQVWTADFTLHILATALRTSTAPPEEPLRRPQPSLLPALSNWRRSTTGEWMSLTGSPRIRVTSGLSRRPEQPATRGRPTELWT